MMLLYMKKRFYALKNWWGIFFSDFEMNGGLATAFSKYGTPTFI